MRRIYKLIVASTYNQVYTELEEVRQWALLNNINCKIGLDWNAGQMLVRLTDEDAVVFYLRFSDWGDYHPSWECAEDLLENYPWQNIEMTRKYA